MYRFSFSLPCISGCIPQYLPLWLHPPPSLFLSFELSRIYLSHLQATLALLTPPIRVFSGRKALPWIVGVVFTEGARNRGGVEGTVLEVLKCLICNP